MFDFISRYYARKKLEQFAPRLRDNTISLLKRAVLASKLVNQYNKPNTDLVLCSHWFITPPIHSLSAFLADLELAVSTLIETSYLPKFKDVGKPESIRLDCWIFSINDSQQQYDLYEGYQHAANLINQLDDHVKQFNYNLTYIERKCQNHLLTFILMTEILQELQYKQDNGRTHHGGKK